MATLTDQELSLIERARRGDWNAFTEHFLALPFSGTWYTPEDRVDTYAILYKVWGASGRPEDGELQFTIPDVGIKAYKIFLDDQYGGEPAFLDPHGYRLLQWYADLKRLDPDVMVVVGGTGSAKTSSVGSDVLMEMALEPGFDFINLAPTAKQSQDMLRDVTKWVDNSRYGDFVLRPRSGGLFKDELGVKVLRVDFGLGAYSTFRCMTLGERQGDFVLGDEADRINVDECGLLIDIDSYIERLITRIRGTRRNGMPRRSKPALGFLSNPHNNPSMDRLVEKAEAEMETPTEPIRYVFGAPSTADNVYTTESQKRLQRSLMSEQAIARWMGGSRMVFRGLGIISTVMIEACWDKSLDDELKYWGRRNYPYEMKDRIGLVYYQLPREANREYLIAGDPGTQPLNSINDNNVPVVVVLDVTGFPKERATLVAYRIFGGEGVWETWVNQIIEWADYYEVSGGAFDATSSQSILSETFLAEYPHLLAVTFAGTQKAIAKTFFQLLAGQGFFRWPFILRLWTEAKEYRETGVGVKKLPDDTLSALFAAAWYMRWRYYNELPDELQMEKKDEDREKAVMEMQSSITRRSRYARPTRYRRHVQVETELAGPPL